MDDGGFMLCVTGSRTDRKGFIECKPPRLLIAHWYGAI